MPRITWLKLELQPSYDQTWWRVKWGLHLKPSWCGDGVHFNSFTQNGSETAP